MLYSICGECLQNLGKVLTTNVQSGDPARRDTTNINRRECRTEIKYVAKMKKDNMLDLLTLFY